MGSCCIKNKRSYIEEHYDRESVERLDKTLSLSSTVRPSFKQPLLEDNVCDYVYDYGIATSYLEYLKSQKE
jgi:hypothetical protein